MKAASRLAVLAATLVSSPALGASLRHRGVLASSSSSNSTPAVNTTTCNGKTYLYDELAGYGLVPGDARDRFGDTLGGLGSAVALDRASWRRSSDGSYEAVTNS